MNRRYQPRSSRAAAPSFHPVSMKEWGDDICPSPLCPLPNSRNPASPRPSLWELCDLRARSNSSAKELLFVFMLLRTLPFSVHQIFPSKLFAFNLFRTLSEKHGGVYQLFPKWNASARTRSRSRQQLTVCGVYPENWLEEPMRRRLPILATLLVLCLAAVPASAAQAGAPFPPLEKWRSAVLAGDSSALASLYSASPPARITLPEHPPASVQEEVAFWSGWKAKGLARISIEDLQQQDAMPGVRQIVFEAVLSLKDGAGTKKVYVAAAQTWVQQGDTWRIGAVKRMAPARLKQPLSASKDLYPAGSDAKAEIAEAIGSAASARKRVLLVFGANWCYDCHVLDEAFHSAEIAPVLSRSFEVVHVDVGEYNKNLDLARQYDVPVERGVPAIAVLDGNGKLLFSQKRREFEKARSLAPEDILDFLEKWKPVAAKP